MHRTALTLVAVFLVAAAPAGAATARLALVSRSPHLVVRGSGFHPRESVTLTTSGQRVVVRASQAGTFLATFSKVPVSRCEARTIRAAGSTGTVAVLKMPQPACMPVTTPSGNGY